MFLRRFQDGKQYTINLYHSTCRILANGRNPEQFYTDFKDIVFYIRSEQQAGRIPLDDNVNEVLRQYLEEHLTSEGNNKVGRDRHSVRGNTSDTAPLESTRTSRTSNKTASEQSTVRKKALNSNACNKSLTSTQMPAIQSNSSDSNIVIEDLANVISKDNLSKVNPQETFTHRTSSIQQSTPLNIVENFADQNSGDAGFQDAPDYPIFYPERPLVAPQVSEPEQITPSTAESTPDNTDGQPMMPMQRHIPLPRNSKEGHPDGTEKIADVITEGRAQSETTNQGSSGNEGPSQRSRNSRAKTKKAEEEMTKDELLAHLRKRETALQKKEDSVRIQAAKHDNLQRDLAHARAHIAMLEDRIKELERDKRDLNQKLLIASSNPNLDNTANTQASQVFYPQPTQAQPISAQLLQNQPSNSDLLHQIDIMRLETKYSNELLQAKHNQELQQIRHNQEIQQIRMQSAIDRISPAQAQISTFTPYRPPLIQPYPLQMYYGNMPGGPFPLGGTPLAQHLQQPTKQPSRKPPYNQYVPNPSGQRRTSGKSAPKAPKSPKQAEKEVAEESNSIPDERENIDNSQESDATTSQSKRDVTGDNKDASGRNESQEEDFLSQTRRTNHETMGTRDQPSQ